MGGEWGKGGGNTSSGKDAGPLRLVAVLLFIVLPLITVGGTASYLVWG